MYNIRDNNNVFYTEEEQKEEEKWNLEQHSKQVRENHPNYIIYTAFLINVVSIYKIYHDFNISSFLLISTIMFFFIDLASGLLHIVLDNPHNVDNKYIGKFADGFQQHHFNTSLVVNMKLRDHLRPMGLVIVFTSYLGLLIHGAYNTSLYIYIVTFSFSICWMQCCHRWSHMTRTKRGFIITMFQKLGICLKPTEHLIHHKSPYLKNFCIMSGVFNPFLNKIVICDPELHPHKKKWSLIFIIVMIISIYLIPKL